MSLDIARTPPDTKGRPLGQLSWSEILRRQLAKRGGPLMALAVVLAIWHATSSYVPEYIFPSIPQVITKGMALLGAASTYDTVWQTLQRIIGGFALSAVFGVALGIAIAMSARLAGPLMPTLKFVMGIPALTWVLLSIIWFKSTELRVWFIMFILVFPIVTVNSYDGVRAVPRDLYDMVRSLRPGRFGLLRMLIVPAAMPFIFSGLKVSLSFGGRIAVFAEALSASTGIGAAMYTMNQMFDSAGIVVWTVILIAVLYILDGLLSLVERRWFRWRQALPT